MGLLMIKQIYYNPLTPRREILFKIRFVAPIGSVELVIVIASKQSTRVA